MLDRKLLFVSGKGGVGKSAVAASLALVAARRGLRVLVIGMTEAMGLSGHFAVESLSYLPRRLRPGIEVLAIERDAALDEYIRLQLRVPRPAPTKYLTRALGVLAETAPGVREIITIGKPIYETWRGDHDLVIVDAAPLGQLFSYLDAPRTIADLVPAGGIQHQAVQMAETLRDPACSGLVLVTTPEELPTLETEEALDRLATTAPIELVDVVANRVLEPLEDVDLDTIRVPEGPHRAAAVLHTSLCAEQRHWLEELPIDSRLPYLFGIRTAGEVAQHLAHIWDGIL
jgi:anion-transporting  ArsA/GET3 family ATPase